MNLNEAFIIVIDFLISEASNEEFIKKLDIIKSGLENKKSIDQRFNPRHQSILLFGYNIFTFRDIDYINMAEEINNMRYIA